MQPKKYRKFNERLGDCEIKLFGQPRDEKRRKQKVATMSKENMNSSNFHQSSKLGKKDGKSPNFHMIFHVHY